MKMYKFNYQSLPFQSKTDVICIVPDDWLLKKLPNFGGWINYVNGQEQMDSVGLFVFVYCDAPVSDGLSRTIYLDVFSNGKKLFDKPATIHCCNIDEQDRDAEWCIEVLLLNHFFGCNELTRGAGNISLDIWDVINMMLTSSNYQFKFGIGDTPLDIIPEIFDPSACHDVKCAFAVLFCDNQKMRFNYLDEVINPLSAMDSEDAFVLFSDVAIEQDKMLVSILTGS